MDAAHQTERRMGLLAATGVGVGAIVGGGILALAGVAFETAGPAAMVAFAINGMIALLTVLSLGEMASKFPESGGTYTYAKKVLSVEAAFGVGWIVWFASIVAAVLYAVGFGYFALVMVSDIWRALGNRPPDWLNQPTSATVLAVVTTVGLSTRLMWSSASGGHWVNVGKVIVFMLLVIGGLWTVARTPITETSTALQPFLAGGWAGLIQAMGYTFIALQGFDLIAAVGGEVRSPVRTIPRAMVLSLSIALAIYLPLLFVVATVGVPPGEHVQAAAAKDPESIVAIAAQQYLGRFGYWLVIVAAVLSMLSALQANLFAASRIALTMARDRTLPTTLSLVNRSRGTPLAAVAVTGGLVTLILIVLPDVGAAGAAASLIFLITFALAHWISFLIRQRSQRRPPPFRSPLFPLVPVTGGIACLALAIFQGVAVPQAGMIAVAWLGVGGLLFIGLFARRARVRDIASTALNPELVTLRGRTPLVLVPLANPRNAEAMIALADALVPADVGRVLMQIVVVAPADWNPDEDVTPMDRSQAVHHELLKASRRLQIRVETLTTVAAEPMREIARVAELHRCESVLLGLSEITDDQQGLHLESLIGTLDNNVVILRSRIDWRLSDAKQILIPVAGRGGHDHLRALLLGSLLRGNDREITFLRVLPNHATSDDVRRASRDLTRLSDDEIGRHGHVEVLQSDAVAETIAARAESADLLVLGVQRLGPRKKLFGDLTRVIARQTTCPIIVMSRRG